MVRQRSKAEWRARRATSPSRSARQHSDKAADRGAPFAPWFFAIVRRLATNRRSRDWRRARLLRLWGWATGGEPASSGAEAALIAHLDAGPAKRAMETLSPMQRACFELVSVRGLSTE